MSENKKFPSGAVSIQENNKMSTNLVPSTSKEPSHNTGQNHPEDSDPKLVSEEKISGNVVVHHVDGEFLYHFFF